MDMSHPLFLLAIATFVLVIAFALWNLIATRRQAKYGRRTTGIGGPNDPLK